MRNTRKFGFFVLALGFLGQEAAASEWSVTGGLGQQLQYNDNFAFSPVQRDSVFGYLLNPRLIAARKSEAWDADLEGQGDIRRYSDSRWDCDNFNVATRNNYRLRRNAFSLNGSYAVNCSYVLQVTDTGVILPNNQSETYQVTPTWTWQWTERDQLAVNGSYSRTTYNNSQNGNVNDAAFFSGNDTYTIGLSGNHAWTRRFSTNEKIYYSKLEYTGSNASAQDLYGFLLGASYRMDRIWSVSANAGPVWVDTQLGADQAAFNRISGSTLGSVANVSVNYAGQLTQVTAGYSDSVNPSAIGLALQTQSFTATLTHRFARHLLLNLSGNYIISESVGTQSSGNGSADFNRDYFTVAAGLTWEIDRQWQLKGSYAYSWQDYQQSRNLQNLNAFANLNLNPGTSDSNVVMVYLNYSWDGVRISR